MAVAGRQPEAITKKGGCWWATEAITKKGGCW